MKGKNKGKAADVVAEDVKVSAEVTAAVVVALTEGQVNAYAEPMVSAMLALESAYAQTGEALKGANGSAWQVARGTVRDVLAKHGAKAAAVVLDLFKARSIAQGVDKGRVNNYAATLNRAIKAAAKGITLPPALWEAGRDAWNAKEGPFSATFAAVTTNRGRKAGSPTNAKPGDGKANEAGSIGAAVGKAVKDAALSELMEAVAPLHGDFRAEFFRGALELARAIAKRQSLATGAGNH